MGEIVGKFRLDSEQALNNLRQLAAESVKIETAMNKAGKSAEDSFIKGSNGAKRLETELKKQPKTLAEMELKLQRLKELLRDDTKIGTDGFKKIRTEIEKTEKEITGLNGKLKTTGNEMSGLGSIAKKVGGMLVAAFAVDRIIEFGKEIVTLAAKSEGVERAFKRIGSPQLLQGLRDATRGTVSDLVLMQNSVKASNFKIPLESLASLFKFAQARARETGESVDYLVDSIILGIGRKSPLILDNLGISAVELRTRLKGVGVEAANVGDIAKIIGDIATEELAKMGDQADTTADKIAQFTTKFENLKVVLGKLISEESSSVLVFFGNLAQAISDDISELDRFKQTISGQSGLKLLNTLTEEQIKLAKMEADATEKAGKVRDAEFSKIQNAVEFQRKVVDSILAELDARVDNNNEIEITTDLIDAEIKKYKERQQETDTYVRSINQLNKELKDLQDGLADAEIGSSKFWNEIDKIEKKTTELNEALAMTNLAEALKVDEDDVFDVSGAVIGYSDEVARETSIADDLWKRHFDGLMEETDKQIEYRKKQVEREKELQDAQRQMNQDFFNATLSSWQTLTQTISELSRIQYEEQQRGLDNLLDRGIISQEEYNRRKASLAREQFKKDKEAKIIQASINTALGVTNAIATAPNIILGLILAAVAAAAGAAEIAVISSAPTPKFAEGGFVDSKGLIKGRKHTQGGVHIEAEGGEFITNAKESGKHSELLTAINKGIADKYIAKNYVQPAIDKALLNGWQDFGKMANLNGLNTKMSDHNLIIAIDRSRQSTAKALWSIHDQLKIKNKNDRYV